MRGPHFLVIGPPLSGKTTAMRSWVLALTSLYAPGQIALVLVDFQQRFFKYGGRRSLAELPHVIETVSEAGHLTEVIEKMRIEYETPDRDFSQYPRPEIFFIADNYDDWASVIGAAASTRNPAYRDLGELARKYGPEGFHAVVCGSLNIMRMMDEFTRQVTAGRYGLGLDSNDAPSALGGRVRGGGAEFPPGRGYIVKSGRVSMMQVATPQNQGSMEESLDEWVDTICERYASAAPLRWLADLLPKPEPVAEAVPAETGAGVTIGAPPGAEDPEIAALKAMIEAAKQEETAEEEVDPLAELEAQAKALAERPFQMSTPKQAEETVPEGDGKDGKKRKKGESQQPANGSETPVATPSETTE
jgi:hypothetical protein